MFSDDEIVTYVSTEPTEDDLSLIHIQMCIRDSCRTLGKKKKIRRPIFTLTVKYNFLTVFHVKTRGKYMG